MSKNTILENWRLFINEETKDTYGSEIVDRNKRSRKKGMKNLGLTEEELDEDCWDGYERNPKVAEGERGSCRRKGSVNEQEESLSAKIRKTLKDEGGAAGMKALVKGAEATEEDIKNAIKDMGDVGLHANGDYILDDGDKIDVVSEGEICDAGISYVIRTDPGGKDIKRGKDTDGDGKGELKNWSARAAQIASKYCKDPDYGKGRGKDAKDESLSIKEAEGGLKAWEKENWTHSDGSPCGDPGKGKDGSDSRCKPASKWKTMTDKEKAADNKKKAAGTKAGKQHVPATKAGKVTKQHTKREGMKMDNQRIMEIINEELTHLLMEQDIQELDEEFLTELENDPSETITCTEFLQREVLDEKKTAAWQRKAGKNKEGGLNAKGRKSYEKANPGSDLKAPVSAKQAKKSKGGKSAKRRKSFCARMCGMKKKNTGAKGKRDPDSRINKSLRKWDCNC